MRMRAISLLRVSVIDRGGHLYCDSYCPRASAGAGGHSYVGIPYSASATSGLHAQNLYSCVMCSNCTRLGDVLQSIL
jgi:hypothetical protein